MNNCRLHITIPEVEIDAFLSIREIVQTSFEASLSKSIPGFAFFATGQSAAIKKIAVMLSQLTMPPADMVVVVGIGGSSLGSKAIYRTLKAIIQLKPTKMVFCDTIDSSTIANTLEEIDKTAAVGGITLVCIISKSGNTTETIVNARIVSQHMAKRYGKDVWGKRTIVLSEAKSTLFKQAQKLGCLTMALDEAVGGRFSLFSPVGVVPLLLARIPAQELAIGAERVISGALGDDPKKDYAFQYAVWLHQQYCASRYIHDLFLFNSTFDAVGAWYRQLFAESLGKKSYAGDATGIVPTVSMGTTDLHSMVQLYLSGPDIYSRAIVSICTEKGQFLLSSKQPFAAVSPDLDGLTNHVIYDAICKGTQEAFITRLKPLCTISFDAIEPSVLGEFFQLYMVTVVYLAHILEVNPFDQPDVELYKARTRRILQGE